MDKVFKFLTLLVLVAGAISLIRVADLQTRGTETSDSVMLAYTKNQYGGKTRYGRQTLITYHYLDLQYEKELIIDDDIYDSIRPPEAVMVQRTRLYGYPVTVRFNRAEYRLEADISYPYVYFICFFNIVLGVLVLIRRDFSLAAAVFAVLGNLIYWAISTS